MNYRLRVNFIVFPKHVLDYSVGVVKRAISDYAFYGCSAFTTVTIPDSVTSIGQYAFLNCSNLNYNESNFVL